VTEEPRVGIVVPAYNEATRLDIQYWLALIQSSACDWLFVDDGSTDETPKILQSLIQTPCQGSLGLIVQTSNLGKAESVRRGLLEFRDRGYSTNDIVGFLDADGAFPLEEVVRFTQMATSRDTRYSPLRYGDFDALWSSRVSMAGRTIDRRIQRHFMARVLHTLIALKHPLLPYDTQCGLKFFRASEVFFSAIAEAFQTRWFFEIEILMRCRRRGSSLLVREEPLEAWQDVSNSKIRGRELLRIAGEYIRIMVS
jgi:glycosyltransferase involved in cell wall biosynthesis